MKLVRIGRHSCNLEALNFVSKTVTGSKPHVNFSFGGSSSVSFSGEDIAAAVSYLAADDAGYVTGQVLVVDGGLPM